MLAASVQGAFTTLVAALSESPALEDPVRARWHAHAADGRGLATHVRNAADVLASELPALTRDADGLAALARVFEEPAGAVLLSWCSASSWRRDITTAPLLSAASRRPQWSARVRATAGDRVVAGPFVDALACAPYLGDGHELAASTQGQVRARLEILVWEAGARALEFEGLGRWIWADASTFEAMIVRPAHGSLRSRVLAARGLEIGARGMPPATAATLRGSTLEVLQPLLLHPEPLVWVHAARALGRLNDPMEELQGMLLDWVNGESAVLRQRALTALASLPGRRMGFLGSQLQAVVAAPEEDPWVLAAVAAATPYLFHERRDIWKRLAARILAGEGGSVTASALARGLATLWRRGAFEAEIEQPLRALREMARFVPTTGFDDQRGWIEVTAITDVIDGAERDPLDLELGLDNLTRLAAQYDDEEGDARAARFAGALAPTFVEARRIAVSPGRPRHRAAAMNALVACARAFALRLWAPLLATRPTGEPIETPDLQETRKLLAEMPAELLELIRKRRKDQGEDLHVDVPLEVLALKLGGYALDAGGDETDLASRAGPTAHRTCLWLRKLEGLADGSRELPPSLEAALSELFWRLVDSTRGTTLGMVDDVQWLGPFAAWWALVIDRPAVLRRLATALPMMAPRALEQCCDRAEVLRTAVASGAADGRWAGEATRSLRALHADHTELSAALGGLARALEGFARAAGRQPDLEPCCLMLVGAADRLVAALADPVKGLHVPDGSVPGNTAAEPDPNVVRVAALVARAITAREPAMLDVWLASLGPVASALVEAAVRAAIRRTPPPPAREKRDPTTISGYELVRPLGEGGIGKVWLVRKPGADRLFVLKIPKADALEAASDTEREGILASFVEEAAALAGLYHPNVANIVDRGVSEGVPFLVLDYLIGADLKQYATARKMTLFELRQIVLDSCAGLSALHHAGLVHRDIKPANLWLRLPLSGGERFDPQRHRDPAVAPPLATVVIDFGMVRASRVPAGVGGRFVAGTAGYIAPEQVLDPVELDGRADVYALAGTIYNVTSGRAFFDEIENYRDRIVAHMQRDPFEDPERLRHYPAAVAELLRAATTHQVTHRPTPMEFGRAFAAAL